MSLTAYVTDIQKFCVHDGPGIRTNVFFQGCPLKCKWCQNPETLSMCPVVLQNSNICKLCKECILSCPNDAISLNENNQLVTDMSKCDGCSICQKECYFLARKFSSRIYTADEIYDEVIKDEIIFKNSGGGITISGGEPLLHKDFNHYLLSKFKKKGINTAVETAGFVPLDTIIYISEVVDLFLFDFKFYSDDLHKHWTGVSNQTIKNNLLELSKIHNNIIIRVPLIPTANDSEVEFTKMMKFISTLKNVNQVHILPFHQYGSDKYKLLNLNYELETLPEENELNIKKCISIAEKFGLTVNRGGS